MFRSGCVVLTVAFMAGGCAPSTPPSTPTVTAPLLAKTAQSKPAQRSGDLLPKRPIGTYARQHRVMVVCRNPDWCEQEVTDKLIVTTAPGQAIDVSIDLVQANAHTCTFRGRLANVATDEWRWQAPASEPPCQLRLSWRDVELRVSSDGCRQFCGARASLDATFAYRQQPQ